MEKLKDTFEIVCNEKTYVSKKMNPIRRALVVEKIVNKLGETKQDPVSGANTMIALFKENLPKTMWEFIKDDDKKVIGTYDVFVENLDDHNTMQFLNWCLEKVKEVNDFLGVSPKEVVSQ